MEELVAGLPEKLNQAEPILGYTDKDTVKLDFDDITFKNVKYWAIRAINWFKLQGCLILKSSENCYHVIFDRKVSWKHNMHIVAWVCLQSKNQGLLKWFIMQCIKESSTVRLSPKGDKPTPRIVYHHGKQTGEIQNYLQYRSLVKKIRDLNKSSRANRGDIDE